MTGDKIEGDGDADAPPRPKAAANREPQPGPEQGHSCGSSYSRESGKDRRIGVRF